MVAFHEAVPGHHLQLSRLQLLTDLPALQRQRSLPVFSEGWGLYAEQLAEEAGLYTDERALLGSVSSSLMRAARLVVDTGLHAFGWSRERALEFLVAHVPMPREVLAAEIDRYVVMPGQALAYLTGKLEILRIREEARAAPGRGVLAARLPRRRPGPRFAADADPGPQHRGLAGARGLTGRSPSTCSSPGPPWKPPAARFQKLGITSRADLPAQLPGYGSGHE